MLLQTVKLAIPVTTSFYDVLICQLIDAAKEDLTIAGIPVYGVDIRVATSGNTVTITDNSTISDPLLIRAICAYARTSAARTTTTA